MVAHALYTDIDMATNSEEGNPIMAVWTAWHDDDHTIIRMIHDGQWTWDDMRYQEKVHLKRLFNHVNHPVQVVMDVRGGSWLRPQHFRDYVRHSARMHALNQVWEVVFIVEETMIGVLLQAAYMACRRDLYAGDTDAGTHYRFALTLDEAVTPDDNRTAFRQQVDPSRYPQLKTLPYRAR